MIRFIFILVLTTITCSQNLIDKSYSLIKNQSVRITTKELINEYHRLLYQFPNAASQNEISFDLAELYYKDRNYHLALYFYVRTSVLYRGYKNNVILLKLKSIIENHEKDIFKPYKTHIAKTLEYMSTSKLIDDLIQFIKVADNMYQDEFFEVFIKDVDTFTRLHPESINNDIIYMIKARTFHRNKDYDLANHYYDLVISLFEDSEFQDVAYFEKAYLQEEELNKSSEAIKTYQTLVKSYPKSTYAPKALFRAASLYNDLENIHESINHYETLVSKYPQDTICIEALFNISKLEIDKESYDLGIVALKRLVKKYPESIRAPEAQISVIEINQRDLNEIIITIQEMEHFANIFPKHEESPYYLYQAGELNQYDLKDNEKALAIYKKIIAVYNGTNYAEKAIDQIQEISRPE